MRNPIRLPAACFLLLCCPSAQAQAQPALVNQVIRQLDGYQSLNYRSVYKVRDFTADTLTTESNNIFFKAPADSIFGYLFSLSSLDNEQKSSLTAIYNGHDLVRIFHSDSTYEYVPVRASEMQGTIPDELNWIKNFLEKHPSKMARTADTAINSKACMHLVVTTRDTLIGQEHNYTQFHLFIDQSTGLPERIIIRSRNTDIGNVVNYYYSEARYFDYRINQNNAFTDLTLPKFYHLAKKDPAPPDLLSPGTIAPDWTVSDADGNQLSLHQLRGKVVLLDYFFIGCYGCMEAIKPLNNLYEKYRNKPVTIISISLRDSAESIREFAIHYKIPYPLYIHGTEAVSAYHVNFFPTFYLIDKNGIIASVIAGYDDDFEIKVAAALDSLLH